ncbi:DUF4097 family beta strand repeat-containing protein [Siphonobacter sp. SORGH_AS_0500]|uniref:DUF4097 family beta strand repeat-containing protein n=1 Tax=Siphonobacter sp. SORGH_AS_0500 TaxID=1864824 RepID=UPI00285FB7DE|nr:DUF4097 family beta strand repeat-containing protein [Siphonobacter sp. SORGH_AS_0500]MDR6196119.1 DUF4097 and DUF4098 domain-containing protein YvlB [Siphonobacter sp. SORGH_AS_0500]
MKRHLLFSVLLLATGSLAAQSNQDEPYQTKTFTGNLSEVRVDISGGSIQVHGGTDKDVKVEMYVTLNNWPANKLDKAEIEKRLSDYDLVMKTEGSSVVLSSRRKSDVEWDSKRSISISFKVFTPQNFTTDLRTSGGSIRLSHLKGSQQFQTSGGSLHMTDVAGKIHGRTSGGSIHLEKCSDEMDLQTSGGSIHAEDLTGKINLRTSGGSLRMNHLNGMIDAITSGGSINGEAIAGELHTRTSGGSIRLSEMTAALDAESSAGSVDVDVKQLNKYLRLRSSAGSVRVRLPENPSVDLTIRGNRVKFPLAGFRGEADEYHVNGKLNGGVIPVTISATNHVSIQ